MGAHEFHVNNSKYMLEKKETKSPQKKKKRSECDAISGKKGQISEEIHKKQRLKIQKQPELKETFPFRVWTFASENIDSLINSVPFQPSLAHYNFKHRFILCVCYLCGSIQLSPQLCRGILSIWARELTGQLMRFDVFQWTFAAYKLSNFQWAPCYQCLSLSQF